MVEDVGRLLAQPLIGLAAGRARRLVGLLAHLGANASRVREQLGGVAALGALLAATLDGSLQDGQRLVRGGRLEVAVVKAGALTGVAGRTGGLDQGEHGVEVAVEAQLANALDVAGGLPLVPELLARTAPEMRITRAPGHFERLLVHICQHKDRPICDILDDRWHQAIRAKV